MSVTYYLRGSMDRVISDSDGKSTPGKMYFLIKGFIGDREFKRPIVCKSIMPSLAKSRSIF